MTIRAYRLSIVPFFVVVAGISKRVRASGMVKSGVDGSRRFADRSDLLDCQGGLQYHYYEV